MSTELVGCGTCKGKKQIVGLGSMPADCMTCKGIGWVEQVTKESEDAFLAARDLSRPNELGLAHSENFNAISKSEEKRLVAQGKKAGRPKKAMGE